MEKQNHFLALLLILGAWPGAGTAPAASPLAVTAWGDNTYGQTTVSLAAGDFNYSGSFTVALKSDGSVVTWRKTTDGTSFVDLTVPVAAQSGVTAIAAVSPRPSRR